MPAKSAAQYGLMQMIAHGGTPRSGVGPSPEVAKEFIDKTSADKRSQFARAIAKSRKKIAKSRKKRGRRK